SVYLDTPRGQRQQYVGSRVSSSRRGSYDTLHPGIPLGTRKEEASYDPRGEGARMGPTASGSGDAPLPRRSMRRPEFDELEPAPECSRLVAVRGNSPRGEPAFPHCSIVFTS